MTDHNREEREALIEMLHHRRSQWHSYGTGQNAELADEILSTLATFKQAHTPTDDEREALSSKSDWEALTLIARDVHNYDGRAEWLSLSGADAGRIAAAAIAAGFRRTVQGEPSDAHVRAVWDALGPAITVAFEYDELRAALRAACEEGKKR